MRKKASQSSFMVPWQTKFHFQRRQNIENFLSRRNPEIELHIPTSLSVEVVEDAVDHGQEGMT